MSRSSRELIGEVNWISALRPGSQMPVFGRDLFLETKPAAAEIAICGLGQFALFIGEIEVNAGIYEPGWTNYKETCLYSVYDVTDCMEKGENRIRVMIGNGMYHVDGKRYKKFRGSFGDPVLAAVLCLTYEDGRWEMIRTDENWSVCSGPVVMSCIYGGEDYDARIAGWKGAIKETADYVEKAEDGKTVRWEKAVVCAGPGGTLKEARQPAVRIQETLSAAGERKLAESRILYDFGRNFAGRIRIRVRGERGQKVVIIPGELLKEDGSINQEFTGGPHYYGYILSGEEKEEWMPRFTYYGQRYALIETEATILSVTGEVQYADCPATGFFSCSNEMYNRIHDLIVGALKSNMQSVFTDCPHREKLGWLEQTHLIGPGILDNFDAGALYEKVLDDMEDSQTADGLVPSICPEYVRFSLGFRDSPEWGSACVLVPWYLYQRYGDESILSRRFAMADRYVRYLLGKCKGGILNYGLGDWLDIGHYPCHPANTPIPVVATAILYQDLTVMAAIAEVLGLESETEWYKDEAEKCSKAFKEAFFYPLSGNYGTGSQTANALALFLDLPEEKDRERVLQNLKTDIAVRNGHFTGGDVGHPYILRALAKYGLSELIAENFMKTDFPSYGYQIVCGATTLCEDWDGPNPEHPVMSQNHFMLGGAEEWFYQHLAGIQVDFSAAEKIRIRPCFVREVDWVDCSTFTPAGNCRVRWERKGEGIHIAVSLERAECIRLCLGETEEVLEIEGTVERIIQDKKT